MAHADDALEMAIARAHQLCTTAQSNGYSIIQDGSLWLSSRMHLEEEGSLYQRSDYSEAMFWIEMCEAEPMPIQGPMDPDLLDLLMRES